MSLLTQILEDPERARCELSFIDFVRAAWHVLEPAHPFTDGWAVEAIAEHLQAVTEGQIRRLLINVPPGCTKSMLTNVFWPAWEWGPRGRGSHRFISASYEQGLATRDLVRCRDLVRSEWYSERWPMQLKEDQDQKTYYENSKTGWRFAASVRAALTGYRGDRIIIDDPHSVKTAESDAERLESIRWFTETVPTRLNTDQSAIVVIMQRLHQEDVSGLILDTLSDQYTHLCLPMRFEADRKCKTVVVMPSGVPFEDPRATEGELLAPGRFSERAVAELEQTLSARSGEYAIASQLQQRPVPREGGLFKVDNVRIVDHAPSPVVAFVRGWDLAATSKKKNPRAAFTVGVKVGVCVDGTVFIADVKREKADAARVEAMIEETARMDGPAVRISLPQDPGQAGVAQILSYARKLQGYQVFGSPESGDKALRAIAISAQVGAGNVACLRATWTDAFLAEMRLFPASTYKDQVDALSRAYTELVMVSPQPKTRVAPQLFG